MAPDLLGRLLVRRLEGELLVARIVEVEAYQESDPASHSFRGRTARTDVMFGPPGHLYVYFTYGMHWCMNAVTGVDGEGSAVLLRAAEPLEGIAAMRRLRGVADERLLCAGPARLTQAFGITGADNGTDLTRTRALYVAPGEAIGRDEIGVSPRVGITVALEEPWRFYVMGSPFLSRRTPPRVTPKAKAKAKARASASATRRAERTATSGAASPRPRLDRPSTR